MFMVQICKKCFLCCKKTNTQWCLICIFTAALYAVLILQRQKYKDIMDLFERWHCKRNTKAFPFSLTRSDSNTEWRENREAPWQGNPEDSTLVVSQGESIERSLFQSRDYIGNMVQFLLLLLKAPLNQVLIQPLLFFLKEKRQLIWVWN